LGEFNISASAIEVELGVLVTEKSLEHVVSILADWNARKTQQENIKVCGILFVPTSISCTTSHFFDLGSQISSLVLSVGTAESFDISMSTNISLPCNFRFSVLSLTAELSASYLMASYVWNSSLVAINQTIKVATSSDFVVVFFNRSECLVTGENVSFAFNASSQSAAEVYLTSSTSYTFDLIVRSSRVMKFRVAEDQCYFFNFCVTATSSAILVLQLACGVFLIFETFLHCSEDAQDRR